MTATRLLTYDEYLELPYTGRRSEFVDGKVVELTPPTGEHTDIARFLCAKLLQHFAVAGMPYDCLQFMAQIEIPQPGKRSRGRDPDLVVCTIQQWKELRKKAAVFRIGNPPLIAIEVLSPGNWRTDMNEKQAEYARAQVPEYWRINPMERWVDVLQLSETRMYETLGCFRDSDRIISGVLPGLELTAEQVLEV